MQLNENERVSLVEQLDSLFGHKPILYLKFTKESEYADELVNGIFYANTPEFYRKLEIETCERGQGDRYELMSVIDAYNVQFIGNETDDFNFTLPEARASLHFESDNTIPLICFTGITIKDMILVSANDSQAEFKLPYIDEDIDKMKVLFGEYCVFFDASELKKSIESYSIKNNIAFELKKIKYCHQQTIERLEAFAKGSVNRFYYKNEDLSYQNEYRLVFDMKIPENHKISIGDLEHHAKKIYCNDLSKNKFIINYELKKN